MRKLRDSLLLLTVLAMCLALAGCAGGKPGIESAVPTVEPSRPAPPPVETTEEPTVEVTEGFKSEEPIVAELPERTAEEIHREGILRTIFFAFDRSELTASAKATLRDNANWLNAHPNWDLMIEGHCDERGTVEYNLALGERRASSVRDYLATLGVERGRVRIVTYGEERPTDRGHDESAWSKNRRAEFRVE